VQRLWIRRGAWRATMRATAHSTTTIGRWVIDSALQVVFFSSAMANGSRTAQQIALTGRLQHSTSMDCSEAISTIYLPQGFAEHSLCRSRETSATRRSAPTPGLISATHAQVRVPDERRSGPSGGGLWLVARVAVETRIDLRTHAAS
jgi:hypothetical protein